MDIEQVCKALCDDDMPDSRGNERDWGTKDKVFDQFRAKLEAKATAMADTHIIPEYTPVSNQGRFGTCAANAGVDLFEMLLGLEQGPEAVVQFSRMFAYRLARVLHKATDVDDGTYLRAVFTQLFKVGVIEEEYFTYKEANLFETPPLDLYTMASNNRIHSFYRVKDDKKLEQVRFAIGLNHPVAFGIPVSKDFCRYKGGDYIWREMDDNAGNHAMLITGVSVIGNQEKFLIRNSWGERWGDKGHCWMDAGLIESAAYDMWVGTRMREFV